MVQARLRTSHHELATETWELRSPTPPPVRREHISTPRYRAKVTRAPRQHMRSRFEGARRFAPQRRACRGGWTCSGCLAVRCEKTPSRDLSVPWLVFYPFDD